MIILKLLNVAADCQSVMWVCFFPPPLSQGDGTYEVCDDFVIDDWLREKVRMSRTRGTKHSWPKCAACRLRDPSTKSVALQFVRFIFAVW